MFRNLDLEDKIEDLREFIQNSCSRIEDMVNEGIEAIGNNIHLIQSVQTEETDTITIIRNELNSKINELINFVRTNCS